MATVVNNPQPVDTGNNGMGFLLGIILLIAAVILLVYFGLPYLRTGFGGFGGTQVTVPDHFNVNVQNSK